MKLQIEDRSIVLLAEAFNTSLFNQLWLVKNGIIEEDEHLITSISSPQLSNFKTEKISILVLPNQLQFAINPELNDNLPYDKLELILLKYGFLPIKAIGVNFKWKQDTEGVSLSKFTQENYSFHNEGLNKHFSSIDSRFGLYLSKDFGPSRLKLSILPVKTTQGEEYVQFSFNFHHDLNSETDFEKSIEIVKNWEQYYNEACAIVNNNK